MIADARMGQRPYTSKSLAIEDPVHPESSRMAALRFVDRVQVSPGVGLSSAA